MGTKLSEAIRSFQKGRDWDEEYGIDDEDCAERLRRIFTESAIPFEDDWEAVKAEEARLRKEKYQAWIDSLTPEDRERIKSTSIPTSVFFQLSTSMLQKAYKAALNGD